MERDFKYLFGPVPSRRLGLSLGVDLVPCKTCTLDCLFCQVGHTTHRTSLRREYVPAEAVIGEIDTWAKSGGKSDVITLAGSGEPTLHSRFGEVLDAAREKTGLPAVLLTNGTLLHLSRVREAARRADLVKVTLSAWDQASFERLHRPAPAATFKRLLEGEEAFRALYKGRLWVEVFLVAGLNDSDENIHALAKCLERVAPDRIHLNTAVRPTADSSVRPVAPERLAQIALRLGSRAEVVAVFKGAAVSSAGDGREKDMVAMLRRRPCTAAQVAAAFHLDPEGTAIKLEGLVKARRLEARERDGDTYFLAL